MGRTLGRRARSLDEAEHAAGQGGSILGEIIRPVDV
jgi:hypothetical protein